MIFLYSLLALAVTALLIFGAPLRAKGWTALGLTAAGAVWSGAKAVAVLASPAGVRELWHTESFVFGAESGSMDALSALFVLMIGIGAVAATLYSHDYLAPYLDRKSPAHVSLHYVSLTVMYFSMLGVVTAGGGYTFLFFWELMTISSFLLILFDAERKEVLRAALTYLVMMHIGFVLLLAGFVRLDVVCGSPEFPALTRYFAGHAPMPLFALFLLGFGMKAGLFPMHVWLPEAHPAAPSHVSALMSGVMIKTGVYGILRVTAAIAAPDALRTAGIVLLAAGVVTGLWGVILAAAQNDVKRLLAYSSIENVGVILIGLGVAAIGKSSGNDAVALCGICGALLHTLNHSFFKSALFFGAGNILSKTHTTSLDALGGLGRHMPVTAILFLTATAAICALPPLNGFVSELLIYLGMFGGIASGSDVLLAAAGLTGLALIGGVVALAFTKLFGIVFLGSPRSHEVAEAQEVGGSRIAAMCIPTAGILTVGLFPQYAVRLATRAAEFFLPGVADTRGAELFGPTLAAVSRTAWLVVAIAALLWWLKSRAQRTRVVTQGPTWGCGFTATNVRMQYTGESFAEGLQSIATPLTQESGEGRAVEKSEIFPAPHNFDIRHKDKIDRLFAAWWVELLHQINQRVMRLRTGKINHYILFALLFLVLVFLLSTLNLL